MTSAILRRVPQGLCVVWLAATLAFAAMKLTPGDPAQALPPQAPPLAKSPLNARDWASTIRFSSSTSAIWANCCAAIWAARGCMAALSAR